MIAKLRSVDVDKLTAEDKVKYKNLYAKLAPDMEASGGYDAGAGHDGMVEGGMDYTLYGGILLCIAIYLYFFHNWGGGGQRLDSNAPAFQSFAKPSAEDIRTARLRRFEVPNDAEGSDVQPKAQPKTQPKPIPRGSPEFEAWQRSRGMKK